MPIIGNLFGKWDRVMLAMEGNDPETMASKLTDLVSLRIPPQGLFDALKSLNELRRFSQYFPRSVNDGPVREVEWSTTDLTKIPAIRQWLMNLVGSSPLG